MPTYEYKCDACGHAFEQFQSIMADPVRKCPACKKLKVKRLISTGAGLIFKGSGFYITDYRDQSYKDKAKADTGSGTADTGAAGGSGGDAKGGAADAKPAAAATDAKSPAASSNAAAAPSTSAPSKSESKSAPKDTGKKGK